MTATVWGLNTETRPEFLFTGKPRLALLVKRLDSFFPITGLHTALQRLLLQFHRFLGIQLLRSAEYVLEQGDRNRSLCRQRDRHVHRLGKNIAGIDCAGDQSDVSGVPTQHDLTAQHQLPGPGNTHSLGKPVYRTTPDKRAQPDLRKPQLGVARHNEKVAGEGQLHPGANGMAVDSGHDRFGEPLERQVRLLTGAYVIPRRERRVLVPVLLEVGADAERAPSAGDHAGADVPIVGSLTQYRLERLIQFDRDGIEALRPIQAPHNDVVAPLDNYVRFSRHRSTLDGIAPTILRARRTRYRVVMNTPEVESRSIRADTDLGLSRTRRPTAHGYCSVHLGQGKHAVTVSSTHEAGTRLRREVGLWGAVLLGLGSIVGTGVFVSVGVAAGIAGPAVVLATFLAAVVATCNALSSAQLAASHPLSGGTYEYGHRYLTPALGFTAGWMFLVAKSASAATAALGFGGYTLNAFDRSGRPATIALAVASVVALTAVAAGGMRRSNRSNALIVSVTLAALVAFIIAGATLAVQQAPAHFRSLPGETWGGIGGLLHATAIMFVAYTGYGRVATLGEEVHHPARTIPRAIILTLLVSMVLYLAVSAVAIGAVGATALADATRDVAAPLEIVSRSFETPGLPAIVALGAVTAMLGVLLNLVLGLSRVLLAMARRGDMPRMFARIDATRSTPRGAVLAVGAAIIGLVMIGDVRVTWSFSAFSVLIYYAITNLAALRLPATERRYPRAVPASGLAACVFLAFWVDLSVWMTGVALIAAGLVGRYIGRRVRRVDGE